MTNTDIQRELLMETRTQLQLLQFALNRERGHENQRAVNTQLNRHPLLPPNQIYFIQRNQTPSQNPRQRTPNRNPYNNATITPKPMQTIQSRTPTNMPGKKIQCNLCKKVGHYSKLCGSAKFMWQSQQITPQPNYPQTRRVRNIREKTNTKPTTTTNQDSRTDANDETVDLENTFFIQQIFDNWNTVNFIIPNSFKNEKPAKYCPKLSDEI